MRHASCKARREGGQSLFQESRQTSAPAAEDHRVGLGADRAAPGEALADLPRYTLVYQRTCKVALPLALMSTVAFAPIETRSTPHYRLSVDPAQYVDGFWRDARILAEAARRYQSTDVLPATYRSKQTTDGMVTALNSFICVSGRRVSLKMP